jgi:6-phospho-3-hexuloisomerase
MTKFKNNCERIISHVQAVLANIKENDVNVMLKTLLDARRIFVLGLGRSSLVLKCFAMRLHHMGFLVAVVGETTVPPARNGDVLLVSSASGRTQSTLSVVQRACECGLKVVLISATQDSPMSKLASTMVYIPIEGLTNNEYDRGTLFEESVFILCETLVPTLAEERNINSEIMSANHANLEIWS